MCSIISEKAHSFETVQIPSKCCKKYVRKESLGKNFVTEQLEYACATYPMQRKG